MPNCKKCGTAHYNFQPCTEAAAQRETDANGRAWGPLGAVSAPPGFKASVGWGDKPQDKLRTVKRLNKEGTLTLVESGKTAARKRMGSLTLPPNYPDAA